MRRGACWAAGVGLAALALGGEARAIDLKGTDPRTDQAPPPVAVPAAPATAPVKVAPPAKEGGCGNHGTTVEFVDSVREAAAQAKKDEKLVFVLHVSGHFEDPRFT